MIRRRLPTSLRYFPLDVAFLVLLGLVIFAQYGDRRARSSDYPACSGAVPPARP